MPLGAVWVPRGRAWSPASEGSCAGHAEGPTPGDRAGGRRQPWARMRGRPGVNQLQPCTWGDGDSGAQSHRALDLPGVPWSRLNVCSFGASVHRAEGV